MTFRSFDTFGTPELRQARISIGDATEVPVGDSHGCGVNGSRHEQRNNFRKNFSLSAGRCAPQSYGARQTMAANQHSNKRRLGANYPSA